MTMRVVHLIHWPRSGIGSLVGELIRVGRGDVEHHVIGFEGEPPDYALLREGSASMESLQLSRRGPFALHRLWARIRTLRPHIVHTHSWQPGIWARLLAAGPRIISTIHSAYPYFVRPDPKSRIKRHVELNSLQWRPVRITCVSEGVQSALPAGWPPSEVVPNGVAVERVRSLAKADFRQFHKSGHLIVSAGRLDREKGFDVLIDAMAKVRSTSPAHLLIVGSGSERAALASQVRRLGLESTVSFAGFQENPFPYLRAADLYVSSSRYEGFGMAVLEAMCLGLPVVTTPTAGMGTQVREGETGFVAAVAEAEEVAAAITRALSDDQRRRRVAANGVALVEQRFRLEETSRRYRQIYQEMIG